jgi:hypothetical protein
MKVILFLISFCAFATELKPFYTDLCTFFPEGTRLEPRLWEDCCVQHDLVYWAGGSKAQQKQSDKELKQCVTDKAGKMWGNLMYRGVRMGHLSPIKSKMKWGHGWGDNRSFQVLDKSEIVTIKALLQTAEISEEYKLNYINLYLVDERTQVNVTINRYSSHEKSNLFIRICCILSRSIK